MYTIKDENTGRKLALASTDFPEPLCWRDANIACQKLGQGWRLPTVRDFQFIWENIDNFSSYGFKESNYWTANKGSYDAYYTYTISIRQAGECNGSFPEWVRAVRDL